MDDIKIHAQSEEGIRLMSGVLEGAAMEVGLHLDERKCGYFVGVTGERRGREMAEQEDQEMQGLRDDTVFLPVVKEGYKYLRIT